MKQKMNFINRILILMLAVALFTGCKSKKKISLSGDEPIEVSDFIDFFPEKKLPYEFGDTSLLKKDKDSLLISQKVFTQFVPDSILTAVLGKTAKPKIYPMGRVKNGETYLFVKVISGEKRVAFVLGFDKKNQFVAGFPFLTLDQYQSTQQLANMDKRYTLNRTIFRKNSDGSVSEGKDVYGLNTDAKNFMLFMTDPLDDKAADVINPIDTFSRKQKYTADYGTNKMNLISIRDGRRSDRISFFIHFEKNNGACTGELKGEAVMKTATMAEYREGGDPCVLQFNFTSSSVRLKEIEGCGARRGLRCSFEGTYPRKKEAKPKSKSSSKSSSKK
jgi:hypothetical protein